LNQSRSIYISYLTDVIEFKHDLRSLSIYIQSKSIRFFLLSIEQWHVVVILDDRLKGMSSLSLFRKFDRI